MKKLLTRILSKNLKVTSQSKMLYAVKKIVKGEMVQYLPVAKSKGLLNDWTPIVKIYPNEYLILPIEVQGLTLQDCEQHIQGHKDQVEREATENFYKEEIIPC